MSEWSDTAWQAIEPIYEQILSSPFITGMVKGTLARQRFNHYIAQDILYLHDYARVLSILAGKLPTLEGTTKFARFAEGVESAELQIHAHYVGTNLPESVASPSCLLYRSFLLRCAAVEPVEVLAAAVLPCFWIYERVGQYAKERTSEDNPYHVWTEGYSGEEFEEATRGARKTCDELAAATTPEMRRKMINAFVMAAELEKRFWNSAYALESWSHNPSTSLGPASNSQIRPPTALSIAGSDNSGGAGIQADIKTMSALGVYSQTAITAVVNENTQGVYGVIPIPGAFVQAQIQSCVSDIGVDAIKIGMLHSADLIEKVRETLLEHVPKGTPVVLDPVMVATSGDRLLEDDAVSTLRDRLIPLATVVTPNIPEAAVLLDISADEVASDLSAYATALSNLFGGVSVLLKGGHLADKGGDVVTDVLFDSTTGAIVVFPSPLIHTRNTHGTGCTLSSALAALLAKGLSVSDATSLAKEYVAGAILAASDQQLGKGHGPVSHFYQTWN